MVARRIAAVFLWPLSALRYCRLCLQACRLLWPRLRMLPMVQKLWCVVPAT